MADKDSEIKSPPDRPTPEQIAMINQNFRRHEPIGDQTARYNHLRSQVKALALTYVEHCPSSRELSLALTKLEESIMWANASIAREA